jgi:hypothetical protein
VKPAPNYDRTAHRFAELIDAYTNRQSATTPSMDCSLRDLLNAYEAKLTAWRKSEESSASDFNLFKTLQIAGDEIRHSMMLEWLLDYRIERAGTHAQGKLGFRFFLKNTGLNMDYANMDYLVSREVKGDSSRVDVEIAATGQFIIHLENKIFSEEGMNQAGKPDQTVREWEDLQRRADILVLSPNACTGFSSRCWEINRPASILSGSHGTGSPMYSTSSQNMPGRVKFHCSQDITQRSSGR